MAEGKMGTLNSKPEDKLSKINREVNSLRSGVRSSRRRITNETKDQLVEDLVKCSNEANALKGKVKDKHLKQLQSNISDAMGVILSRNPQDQDLDMGAVETSSFVQLSPSKRQMSSKDLTDFPSKKTKSNQIDLVKVSVTTLEDIGRKLRSLEPEIELTLKQKDTTQLRVHKETLKVLMTELEMIEVKDHTPLDEKQIELDKDIRLLYQKISKVMKDVKRERDIHYLVKYTKKNQDELEEIDKELNEIQIEVFSSIKANDQSAINSLRENLLSIKHRLSFLDIPDETIKQKRAQLLTKLTDILKIIEDYIEGSSQSYLNKAQMNYEELIKNIASGNSLDKDEIKTKLLSLQSFINSINDDNENILKGKQQLLNNVRQSFSFILDNEKKIQNTTVEGGSTKIENELRELDNFLNSWKSLERNLNPSSLDDFSKMDAILSDIQKSIEDKRQQFVEQSSSSFNIKNKLNRSTPNLRSQKGLKSKFGSSLSVDQADQSLIKARVKVYDLSTPQVQNISDQPVVLRNKQFYQKTSNFEDSRPFSKLEEIKTQVNYIKEKFDESHQKQHLKNKLESYVEIINDYIHHQNQRIANSSKALLEEIKTLLKNIPHIPETMNAMSERRASIELSFENVVAVQGSVEQLEEQVACFEGKQDDLQYKKLNEELYRCREYLESVEIPPKYDMIQQQKEEILNKIHELLNILDSKCFHAIEPIETKKELDSLKGKVNRFTGPFGGVLYNQIEKDLNKILVNLAETVDDKALADDITKDVEKHLNILKHRSTRDQSFRRASSDSKSRNEDEDTLIKLKSDLMNIKKSIDTTPTNAVNLFLGLKSRLDLVKLGLDQLKFTLEEEDKQKDILYNEVETLRNVVEAKISLAKQVVRQWPVEQDKEKMQLEELSKIEESFNKLKPEIENFTGTTSDNKFYELDENSIRLILKMDKLQFARGTEIHKRKVSLLKEIYNYGDLLDQRAKESEELLEVERGLRDVEKNFARNLKLNDWETSQEKVVALKTKLDNGQYNDHLLLRKQGCLKLIEGLCEKILAHKEQSTNDNIENGNTKGEQDQLISNIESQFGNIMKEIESFSGTHSDAKYYEINSSLTALFLKLDNIQLPENSDLRSRKIVLLKEMRSYTDVLYNKAVRFEAIKEVDKQLNAINTLVDNYKGNDNELKAIENGLRAVQKEMQQLNVGESERGTIDRKFGILCNEYNRYLNEKKEKINAAKKVSEDAAAQRLQSTVGVRLHEIENEIYLVRNKVLNFMNRDSSEEYKTIEDTLLRLKMRLNKLEVSRNARYIKKQHELENHLRECFSILDDRSFEIGSIMDAEETIDKIAVKLSSAVDENEKCAIDEELISLQVGLGKLHVNKDFVQRKNQCIDSIIKLMKDLKQ